MNEHLAINGTAGASVAPLSITDLFTIGIGPSSSHTVGPMRAARRFVLAALAAGNPVRVTTNLFGSLALTGRGHATDTAVLLGLSGEAPETVDPHGISDWIKAIRQSSEILLGGATAIQFDIDKDLVFRFGEFLDRHPNAMTMRATYLDGKVLERTYFSIGGGAVVEEGEAPRLANVALPLPFASAAELLEVGREGRYPSPTSFCATRPPFGPATKRPPFSTMLPTLCRDASMPALLQAVNCLAACGSAGEQSASMPACKRAASNRPPTYSTG